MPIERKDDMTPEQIKGEIIYRLRCIASLERYTAKDRLAAIQMLAFMTGIATGQAAPAEAPEVDELPTPTDEPEQVLDELPQIPASPPAPIPVPDPKDLEDAF